MRIAWITWGQLHATLYVAHWYVPGNEIGRFVELSTASLTTPDLVRLERRVYHRR